MAYFQEASRWTPTIYCIERNDPLLGGEYGINNVQARQLANRTQYLLAFIMGLQADATGSVVKVHGGHNVDGTHSLTEGDVSPDAGIQESKLALSHSTAELMDLLSNYVFSYEDIIKALYEVQSTSGTDVTALYNALIKSWEYSDASYDFCLFTKEFHFADPSFSVAVTSMIANDDSVNVEDQSKIVEDESYVLAYDGGKPSVVVVDKILDHPRVLLSSYSDLTLDESANARLVKSTWREEGGVAHVVEGDIMLTRFIETIQNYASGQLSISHTGRECPFEVEYRHDRMGVWSGAALSSTVADDEGVYVSTWSFTAGAPVMFKITAIADTTVDHMAVYSNAKEDAPAFVRCPNVYPTMKVDRFGALYNDEFDKLEIHIATTSHFTEKLVIELRDIEMIDPVIDIFGDVNAVYPLITGVTYYWYAKYYSKRGYESEVSKVLSFTAV